MIAYLINRVPRTYAAAKRVFTEIHRRFPAFKPRYFIDFGSGLSSGSLSSLEVFNSLISIMNV